MAPDQQYPPGTQNIFKDFPTNNDVTENGKEPNYLKGGRGFEGGSEGVGGSPYRRSPVDNTVGFL